MYASLDLSLVYRGKRQLLVTDQLSNRAHDINSAGQVVYVLPLPSPPSSMNLQPLNLKSEVHRRKTFKYWRVPFMGINQLAAAGFFSQTGVMWFVVRFVEWKSGSGKEMMHLRTISVAVHFAHLLRGCL